MWLESIRESENHTEKCPTCGGGVQRRVYGEMYAGAFIQDGERVEIRQVPTEGFSDPIVLDPLTQYFDGGLYRLWPGESYYSRGGRKLHRAVWETAFGSIRAFCHIHHKDHNPAHNAVDNLECLPRSEHLSESWRTGKAHILPGAHFTEHARQQAAAWHASEEGRLWHSRHASRSKSWTKWHREDRPCLFCGKAFSCLIRNNGHSQKYCTQTCKAAFHRRRRFLTD